MSEMVNHNNQAGRLHKILTEAANQSDNISTIQAWANVFGLEVKNKTEIFNMMILLHKMSDEIKHIILNTKNINSKLLLSQHEYIENVVKITNFDTVWSSYKSKLNLAVMLNLAHCADALSRYDENPIEEDELKNLDTDINDLFNKVNDSSIDVELKLVILDLLEGIRRSIVEYKIRGAKGIRDQLAYCFGKVFQNKNSFVANKESDEVKSLFKIFARADNMTTVALNLVSIGTSVINLLCISTAK